MRWGFTQPRWFRPTQQQRSRHSNRSLRYLSSSRGGNVLAIEDGAQSEDSEEEEDENGDRDYQEEAESAAEVGGAVTKEHEGEEVGVMTTLMGAVEGRASTATV